MSYEYDFKQNTCTAVTTYTGKYLTLWWFFFFIQIVLINLKWVLFKSKYNAVKVNLKQDKIFYNSSLTEQKWHAYGAWNIPIYSECQALKDSYQQHVTPGLSKHPGCPSDMFHCIFEKHHLCSLNKGQRKNLKIYYNLKVEYRYINTIYSGEKLMTCKLCVQMSMIVQNKY